MKKKRLGEHTDITEVKKERAESYFTEASGKNQESPLIPTNNAWKKPKQDHSLSFETLF